MTMQSVTATLQRIQYKTSNSLNLATTQPAWPRNASSEFKFIAVITFWCAQIKKNVAKEDLDQLTIHTLFINVWVSSDTQY